MNEPPPPPIIETKRLRLRPFVLDDAPVLQCLAGERAIADTTLRIPHPYPDGAAEDFIRRAADKFAAGEGLNLAVSMRETGELIGSVGLAFRRDDANAEMGYWIATHAWGRGYATEAALALLRHGFEVLDLHRIYAHHFARNPASGRVLEKIGMKREGYLREHVRKWDRFEDLVLYGILKREYDG